MHDSDCHTSDQKRRFIRGAGVLLSVGLLCLATACQPTKKITIPQEQVKAPVRYTAASDMTLSGQAQAAWNSGNMPESERLYGVLARNADTPTEERGQAWERLTKAALGNRHPHTVLDALVQWRTFDATAPSQGAWQQAWGRSLMQLSPPEARRRALLVWNSPASTPAPKVLAGDILLLRGTDSERPALGEQLNTLYAGTDVSSRQLMEQGLMALLGDLPDSGMAGLVRAAGQDQDHRFPWSVVLLEMARREKTLNSPTADALLARISGPGVFADPTLVSGTLEPQSSTSSVSPVDSTGALATQSSGCFVMALPLSGDFAPIGRKVARGATAAQQELGRNGLSVEVKLLDTETPQWLDELAALPPQCVAVGGPLRPDAYAAAKARGITSQRAFFTFFPRLDAQDEGVHAWRFFSSPEDQVTAVLRFARELGLTEFAALYPEEPYGQRMTDLFKQAAGSGVVKATPYPPADTKAWNEITRSFVGSYMINKTPVSASKFQAVFLPDSWDKDVVLIPYLFFHGEDRLLLMGTALWEQSLQGNAKVDVNNLGLAVFPGTWNSATPTAAAAMLIDSLGASGEQADAWVGLGYDFVRFASAMGLKGAWTAQEVNARISEAQNMTWSMAPIHWSQGKASQQLLLFTPTSSGFELANPDVFRERLKLAGETRDRRIDAAKKGQ